MPKVKVKRQGTFIDMTAMCDVAFLLLTFFILTTQFKPQEPVQVDVPSASKPDSLPNKGVLLISVDKDGRAFLGVDDQGTRELWVGGLSQKYGFQLTADMVDRFKKTDNFGMPAEKLAGLFALPGDQLAAYKQEGIPCQPDSTNNQLAEMIYQARLAYMNNPVTNPDPEKRKDIEIAIKVDKECNIENLNKVIESLRNQDLYKYHILTLEKRAKE